MGTFRITAPCAYTVDGAAHVHTVAGAVVELDEATAAELGAAAYRLGDPTPADTPTPSVPQVEVVPDVETPRRGRRNSVTEETPPPVEPEVAADGQ